MNADVRDELERLADARGKLGAIVAVAESVPQTARDGFRQWRSDLTGWADIPGELGALVEMGKVFESVLDYAAATAAAEPNAARHLGAAKAAAYLRLQSLDPSDRYQVATIAFLNAVRELDGYEGVQAIADLFARIPLRTSLTHAREGRHAKRDRESDAESLPVADLTVRIDGKPWIGARMLRVNHAYPVAVEVGLSHLPKGLEFVSVTGISSLGSEVVEWKPIVLAAAECSPRGVGSVTLIGRATTDFKARAEVRLSARAMIAGREHALSAIGTRHLEVVFTDLRVPTMDKGPVPLSLYELLEDVRRRHLRFDAEHWSDFEQLLRASLEFQLAMLQGGEYRDTTARSEAEFQADVRKELRARLGPDDVQEAGKVGGGELDLRYRSVTDELKVERQTSDLEKMVQKYAAQPSQYSAVTGRQLAVLTVLDVTAKKALGHVANYVRVVERVPSQLAGVTNPIPLITVVIVIAANYQRPSDLR